MSSAVDRIINSELAQYARHGALVSMSDNPGALKLFEGIWRDLHSTPSLAHPHVFSYQVENLSAGTDIGDGTAANARTIFIARAALMVGNLAIVSQGTPAGIDDSNTLIIRVWRGTSLMVTKTYDTANPFPADHTDSDLGALANDVFAEGEDLRFDAVGGPTANVPSFMLQGEFGYV